MDGPLSEAALRAKLEALGYRVARYTYEPGTGLSRSHARRRQDSMR